MRLERGLWFLYTVELFREYISVTIVSAIVVVICDACSVYLMTMLKALVEATETAVRKRRHQLKERRAEIEAKYPEGEYYDSITTLRILDEGDINELMEIRFELRVIENLMISTQREYQKRGGHIGIEIRHSDEPAVIQNEFEF